MYQDGDAYEKVDGHIGCSKGGNLGFIGIPKDILNDVSTKCEGGGAACIDLGKRACDAKTECWGFAINNGWGVQIYNSSASNTNLCNGKYGLTENTGWTTYKKISGNMF